MAMKKLTRIGLAQLLILALAVPAGAVCSAVETLTVTSAAAVGITQSKYLPTSGIFKGMYAKKAIGIVETGAIRIWYKAGETPTTAVGLLLQPGATLKLEDADEVQNFRAIAVSTTAKVTLAISH